MPQHRLFWGGSFPTSYPIPQGLSKVHADATEGAGKSTAGGSKYDFSSLSLAEVDAELSSQQANFERDVGKLRKQYEKRGRALRAARKQLEERHAEGAAQPG